MLICETWIEKIAQKLKIPSHKIRVSVNYVIKNTYLLLKYHAGNEFLYRRTNNAILSANN